MDPKQDKVKNESTENASSEEIRSDIKGIRRGMDETLDELGARLHPRHLLDEVIDIFRSSPSGSASRRQIAGTSKRLGRTVANELREHPLAALLVGAGLVWWIVDATTNDGDEEEIYVRRRERALPVGNDRYAEDPAFEGTTTPSTSGMVDDDGVQPSAKDTARELASSAGEKLSGAASVVSDKISEAASSVGETASDLGGAARRYSARGRRAVRLQAGVLQDRLRAASEEYPLAVGGAFLAAGLLSGLLLPRTEQEDEWMGEASDELKEQTRRKGKELVEEGKEAAARTADAALDEAEKRGMTPDSLAEKARRVVSEATSAAKETAREEGVAPSHIKEEAKGGAGLAGESAKPEGKAVARESSR
jgi:hypothetical protein